MRILVYVEPHPIRNSYEQFTHVGRLFAQALLHSAAAHAFEFRLFANYQVADQLAAELPSVLPWLLRPTQSESERLDSFAQNWDELAIATWLELVRGTGRVTAAYTDILRRLHGEFPFDVILLWSENGAVRSVARELGVTVVHGELGPTRAPFSPTIYLDPTGTNGNAAVTRVPRSLIESMPDLSPEVWLAPFARKSTSQRGVLDARALWPSATIAELMPRRPFAFVAMQLADDLNTLCHSPYPTPTAFIEHVVPALAAQDLDIVIKGHPAVSARPYNIAMEALAFAKACALSERVSFVPAGTDAFDTLSLVAQAELACSINSSLGFEAMLLGKQSALFGAAVYDPHGRIRERGAARAADEESRRWDRQLTTFLMGHYFLPTEDVFYGDALLPALQLIHHEQKRQGDFGERFYRAWIERMAFGYAALVPSTQRQPTRQRPLAAYDMPDYFSAEARLDHDTLQIEALLPGRFERLSAACVEGRFLGSVDEIEHAAESCWVRGWALDAGQRVPARFALVVSGTSRMKVLACTAMNEERSDVIAFHADPSALRCGFRLQIPTSALNDGEPLAIVLVSAENQAQICAFIPGLLRPVEPAESSTSTALRLASG